jgi:hypothetical protein
MFKEDWDWFKRQFDAIGTELIKLERKVNSMATKEQLDKLRTDVAALIQEAVQDITLAVDKAQAAPVETADAAIDQLDTDVTAATQTLKDVAAKLNNPPA